MRLAFSVPTYLERLERVRARMRSRELDAIVVTSPESICWLAGYDCTSYSHLQGLIVLANDSEPHFFTRTTEASIFWDTSWLRSARFYDIELENPVKVLSRLLSDLGLNAGRIGVNLQATSKSVSMLPGQWDMLRGDLPEVAWIDATDLVLEERLIKSPAELGFQWQAAQMADFALNTAIAAIRPGMSEIELAGIAAKALADVGSEYVAVPPMVVSGSRSALVHGMATRQTIGLGDTICIELGACVNRYHAIVMRTIVLGRPSPRMVEVAACLKEGLEAAIASVKPGVPVGVPDEVCNARLDRLDLRRRRDHRMGYSLGLAYPSGWMEPPMLIKGDSHTFAPGMVFSLEPNISLQDEGFGLKLGDTVMCTEDGAMSLTRIPRDLIVIDNF
ncbi:MULTISPECIES: Xaa-Pro peptidase family protein [Hyphomicrobiales]|uniref:Creatinase n=2 Tax=Brucella TaxID=234 RepID=M5JS13_9HYPH|nr:MULTISPECIES: Xaa-Pro peptidase family protein [Brucella]ELT50668.1 creatinase [Brucella intermedia M86]KAB2790767.1 aminopeptidase P family protein [Brucella anthropi]